MCVCIYTYNAMLCICGTLLQLETPSGHILECVGLVFEQAFLDVNLVETCRVYNILRVPKNTASMLRPCCVHVASRTSAHFLDLEGTSTRILDPEGTSAHILACFELRHNSLAHKNKVSVYQNRGRRLVGLEGAAAVAFIELIFSIWMAPALIFSIRREPALIFSLRPYQSSRSLASNCTTIR